VAQTATASEAHPATSTGIPNAKLAMWTFLGSECLLFGAMISVFLLYRGRVQTGPTPGDVFDIPFTSVSSFVLLMSSLTMVLALAAFQRGEHARGRLWLVATAMLGTTFVSGQIYEFTVFVQEGFTVRSSSAGSAFFVLTSFHGAHVTLGIIMLLSLVGFSKQGRLPAGREPEPVEYVGLYWHFVDIVWIVIFTVIYLIPTGSPA
jgi:cytochrome c oxidase subunit 3/cytochrome o ubiquinol oxidase subunit 3